VQPLRLPDDFNLTINNKFGLILRNDIGDNYSLSVKGLDDYDVTRINQLGGNMTAFMNASADITENTWYKVEAMISEDETTATLYDVNGTLLKSTAIAHDKININELVILIADNMDRAVAFKNLKVETLNNPTQPPASPESDKKAANGSELLALYVNLAIFLVAAFAAVVYVEKRRQARVKNKKKHTLILFSTQL